MAKPMTLVVTFDPEQGTRVQGPLRDQMLCYAMLQRAMDIVRDFHAQARETQEENRIVPASMVMPPGKM